MKTNISNPTETIASRIKDALASTVPNSRERKKALLAIKWVMAHESGLCAGLIGLDCALVHPDKAQIFSACDNEVSKLRFWQASLGVVLSIIPV